MQLRDLLSLGAHMPFLCKDGAIIWLPSWLLCLTHNIPYWAIQPEPNWQRLHKLRICQHPWSIIYRKIWDQKKCFTELAANMPSLNTYKNLPRWQYGQVEARLPPLNLFNMSILKHCACKHLHTCTRISGIYLEADKLCFCLWGSWHHWTQNISMFNVDLALVRKTP